jgi:hypothetical protein
VFVAGVSAVSADMEALPASVAGVADHVAAELHDLLTQATRLAQVTTQLPINVVYIISRGGRLFGLSDFLGDIELYTYSESAIFSLSYDVYNSISP